VDQDLAYPVNGMFQLVCHQLSLKYGVAVAVAARQLCANAIRLVMVAVAARMLEKHWPLLLVHVTPYVLVPGVPEVG
jgi:hypothetical protein